MRSWSAPCRTIPPCNPPWQRYGRLGRPSTPRRVNTSLSLKPTSTLTRQQTSAVLAPVPASGVSVFNLDTAQVLVSYTFDVWGLNRRTVELLEALADTQRFQVEAAYLTLTSNIVVAAITEASLRAQIDATYQIIAINTRMLGTLRTQLNAGYANRNDVAIQEAALAQAEATLPPLRKALDQQRDLLAALSGGYPSQGPREVFRLADLHLPADILSACPHKSSSSARTCVRRRNSCTPPAHRSASPPPTCCRASPSALTPAS